MLCPPKSHLFTLCWVSNAPLIVYPTKIAAPTRGTHLRAAHIGTFVLLYFTLRVTHIKKKNNFNKLAKCIFCVKVYYSLVTLNHT